MLCFIGNPVTSECVLEYAFFSAKYVSILIGIQVTSEFILEYAFFSTMYVCILIGIQDTSATDFIREGWQRNKSGEPCNDKEMILGSVTIKPGDSTLHHQKDGEVGRCVTGLFALG